LKVLNKMEFKEAVEELKKGKKIRRCKWTNKDYYIYVDKDMECGDIWTIRDTHIDFNMSDFVATDWEVYESKIIYYSWTKDGMIAGSSQYCNYIEKKHLNQLKEKIIEDMDEYISPEGYISSVDIEDILNKRLNRK